jgi:hypothetical protein
LFAVGIFTRRATGLGAVLGFVGSAALLGVVKSFTAVHFFLYPAIGVGACFAIAYTIGLVTPATGRDLEGLTVFSLNALRKSE